MIEKIVTVDISNMKTILDVDYLKTLGRYKRVFAVLMAIYFCNTETNTNRVFFDDPELDIYFRDELDRVYESNDRAMYADMYMSQLDLFDSTIFGDLSRNIDSILGDLILNRLNNYLNLRINNRNQLVITSVAFPVKTKKPVINVAHFQSNPNMGF